MGSFAARAGSSGAASVRKEASAAARANPRTVSRPRTSETILSAGIWAPATTATRRARGARRESAALVVALVEMAKETIATFEPVDGRRAQVWRRDDARASSCCYGGDESASTGNR